MDLDWWEKVLQDWVGSAGLKGLEELLPLLVVVKAAVVPQAVPCLEFGYC